MTRHYYSIIILFVLCFSIQARPAAAQTLLRVATPGALTGALPIYLGAKKGIFTKYGLTVEVIATRNEQTEVKSALGSWCSKGRVLNFGLG
jgi:ABC-type nitrate/sulfonate/bicarbonate transport system substrate-binding protein